MTRRIEPDRDVGLQGHYAGIITRLVAFAVDVFVVLLAFSIGAHLIEFLINALFGTSFELSQHPIISDIALAVWAFLYCAYPLAVTGHTLGMTLLGLRVVGRDGSPLTGGRAVVRVLVFPLSFAIFCFGFVLILLKKDRRALHDLIAGTAVVYAWDARAARLRFLAKNKVPT
jgi:uncharacterized RDD family membrane protein YckC